MRLSEFDAKEIANFNPKLFSDVRVPNTWTGKSIALFVFDIHDKLSDLNSYIQDYTDFVTDNAKKYRISQPVNADKRPGNAIRGLIDSTKKILIALDKLGKGGKLSEDGQGQIIVKKMRSQLGEIASSLKNLVSQLKQNPPKFEQMTTEPIQGVTDKLVIFNKSFIGGLEKLALSLYSAAENL